MLRIKSRIATLSIAALSGVLWLETSPSAQTGSGCGAAASRSGGATQASHAYFDTLIARPDCWKAYTLRDNDQLKQYANSKAKSQRVTYDFANDTDPRKQDAAKLVVPAGKVSLGNTVRLPIGTEDGTTTLVTWDAWFGKEFRFENTGISNYKTFQFASPADRIWFEVRTRFKQDKAQNVKRAARAREPGGRKDGGTSNSQGAASEPPPAQEPLAKKKRDPAEPRPAQSSSGNGDRVAIGAVDARGYDNKGTTLGPNVLRGAPLSPQAGTFIVKAETWTRYWVLIEQRRDDWDLMSLWVADENNDAVRIIDRLQFAVKGSVDSFWLEYNTSSKGKAALGERVGYVRNVAMLRNARDVEGLLVRPVK
jgi:hypothetical protein